MLDEVDASLELFLRGAAPLLSSTDVDVSFDAPDRAWSSKLTRPTVNLFLWDIRRSTSRARTGVEQVERNGEVVRRMALPTVDLKYLATAWTPDRRDERGLLSGVMRAVLSASSIPTDCLTPALAGQRPPSMNLTRAGDDHVDVIRALDGQLKPSVGIVIAADVDTGLGEPVGVAVTEPVEVGMEYRRIVGEAENFVGRTVRRPDGERATVNSAGRFMIWAKPGEVLVLETESEPVAIVPEIGGVRFE